MKLPNKKCISKHNDGAEDYIRGWNSIIDNTAYTYKVCGDEYTKEDLLKRKEYYKGIYDSILEIERLNKKLEELDYQEAFAERTKEHINRVVKYGKIIGKNYNNHDIDKLTTLFDDYALMKKKKIFGGSNISDNSDGLTKEEQERLNKATETHITANPHHPEYWCKEGIKDFDRFNPPMGLHCEDMPKEALEEMCADWCAMSEEFDNTPFEWLDKTVPSRWIFTNDQLEYINKILHTMWDYREKEK